MNRMSFSETIFLFVLALVIFGPKKLPEIARQVGKYMNEFRRASNEFKAQIEQEIAHLDVEKPTILPPSPAPEGTASRSLTAANVESGSADAPATAAPGVVAAEDEPLFATKSATAEHPTEPSADVTETPNSTQESHA